MTTLKKALHSFSLNLPEFLFQFQSHPNYPSALAFSDTLNFLGVKNEAYNLEKEYWEELPEEFITIHKNEFALIHRIGDQAKIFSDKEEMVSFEDVKKYSENFILLFEKKYIEKTITTKNTFYYFALFFGTAILLTNNLIHWDIWSFVFQILSFLGVYIFSEIFKEKFGSESVVLQSFCGAGTKQNTSEEGCKKIIQSNDFELFGLKFSDFGFIYFVALAILPLFIAKESLLFIGITSLSLLGVIYSVYYQIRQKIFCKVCGLVIGILVLQFVISFFNFRENFSITELLLTLFIILCTFFLIHYISKTIEEKEQYKTENIKNLRFKRNYEIFRRELLDTEQVDFKNPKAGFFFGNKKSKLHITLISNPFCGYCKDAHKILENILQKYPEEISAQVRFNYLTENQDEKLENIISSLNNTYSAQGELGFLKAVHFWFEKKDENNFLKEYPVSATGSLKDLEGIGSENLRKGLSFTPIFLINGNRFPDKYDREDIFYFLDDLLEDEEIINEKHQEFS